MAHLKHSKREKRCRPNTPAVLTCSLFNGSSKFQILQRLFNVFPINGCNKRRKHHQFGEYSEERRPQLYSDAVLSITLQYKSEAGQHSRDLKCVYSASVSPGIPVHADKSIRNIGRKYSTMTWTHYTDKSHISWQ